MNYLIFIVILLVSILLWLSWRNRSNRILASQVDYPYPEKPLHYQEVLAQFQYHIAQIIHQYTDNSHHALELPHIIYLFEPDIMRISDNMMDAPVSGPNRRIPLYKSSYMIPTGLSRNRLYKDNFTQSELDRIIRDLYAKVERACTGKLNFVFQHNENKELTFNLIIVRYLPRGYHDQN